MSLVFTPEGHKYEIDGRRLPSVSQVLQDWYKIDRLGVYHNPRTRQVIGADVFENAGDRGTAVHRILEYLLTGKGIDRAALDTSLYGYLEGVEAWIKDYEPEAELVETPLADVKMGYAGTLDFFGRCKGIKNKVLMDLKTGVAGNVEEQLAAYENLVRVNTGYRGLIDRYHLHVSDGGYTFSKVGTPTDFTKFRLRLSLYKMEERNG